MPHPTNRDYAAPAACTFGTQPGRHADQRCNDAQDRGPVGHLARRPRGVGCQRGDPAAGTNGQKGCGVAELRTLMSGLVFGEQPRWHEDRLWFSDWGTQEVIAVDLAGNSEVILRGASFPLCVDWLPEGR